MPFDDSKPPQNTPKVGLKLQNSNSMFANVVKKPTQQELHNNVQQMQEKSQGYKERAADLALQFRKMLDDKTLLQNKNVFLIDLEREVLLKIAHLTSEMNLDEEEDDGSGVGSIGMITLLLRCLLIQRDKINELDYSLNQLNLKLKNIQSNGVDVAKISE